MKRILSLTLMVWLGMTTIAGAGPILVDDPMVLGKGVFQMRSHVIYRVSDKLFDDGRSIYREGEESHFIIPFEYYYGATDRLRLGLVLPYIFKTWAPDIGSTEKVNGISDTKIQAKYKMIEDSKGESLLSVSLGLTIPAWKSAFTLRPSGGMTMGAGVGNGSWDINIWSYLYKKMGKFNLYGIVGYDISLKRKTDYPEEPNYTINRGNTLNYDITIDYPVDIQKTGGKMLIFGLELGGMIVGDLEKDGIRVSDKSINRQYTSGSDILFLGPSIQYEYAPGFMFEAVAGFPLSGDNECDALFPVVGFMWNY